MTDEDAASKNDNAPSAPIGAGDAISAPGPGDAPGDLGGEDAVMAKASDASETPGGEGKSLADQNDPRPRGNQGAEIDPVAEDKYWSDAYSASPNLSPGWDYKTFQPACRYGWESFQRYRGRTFGEVEPELKAGWDQHRGDSRPDWDKAKPATRAAWNRVERASPKGATRNRT